MHLICVVGLVKSLTNDVNPTDSVEKYFFCGKKIFKCKAFSEDWLENDSVSRGIYF